jgi:hypothetical protein
MVSDVAGTYSGKLFSGKMGAENIRKKEPKVRVR